MVPALTCVFAILRKQHTKNPNKTHPAAGTVLATGTPMVVFLLQITALLLTGVTAWKIMMPHLHLSIAYILLTKGTIALTSLYLLYKIVSEHVRHQFEPHFVLFLMVMQLAILTTNTYVLAAFLPSTIRPLGFVTIISLTLLFLLSIPATIILGYRWVYGLRKRRSLHYALTVFLLLLLLPAMFLVGEYHEAVPAMPHF